MSLGNGNYKDGNKGSNFDFEVKTLMALEQIRALIAGLGGSGEVLVSGADTTLGFISAKLTGTSGIIDLTIVNPGANETLDLDVANSSITYGKIQNVSATDRILGRDTAGAGVIEELTASQVLDFLGSTTANSIIYRGAGGWTTLNPGSAGQLLQTGNGATPPQWVYSHIFQSPGSNQTTTSGSLVNVGGTSISLDASSTYIIEINMRNGCSGVGGSRFGIVTPAGATTGGTIIGYSSTANAQGMLGFTISGSGEIAQTVCQAAVTEGGTTIKMKVITGVSSGTFQLQFRSVTGGQTTSVYTDSFSMLTFKAA